MSGSINFLQYQLFHVSVFCETDYNGSFEGVPAFLGYFLSVHFFFSIIIIVLYISVWGSLNSSMLVISPPRIFIAFFAYIASSFPFVPFIPIAYPPILTNGDKYSLSTFNEATALAIAILYFSL